jgi:tetratricopeptide (TPR) repeat protein
VVAARQYEAANEQFEKDLRLSPIQRGGHHAADCYFYKGLYEKGIAALQKAAIGRGQDPQQVAQRYDSLREAYLKSGPKGYWQRELEIAQAGADRREGSNPMNLAVIYAWLGDKELCLVWLQLAVVERGLADANLTPVFDLVRSDPRYRAMLKTMALPEPVWKQ